ncbi:hypothetical protein TWF694_006113 [Orbilia ellipsospora]|uniref:Uncharacterized protein n=1 Tax=Orbilia ellipsospora TaxID=2528407 RepID=A0AAV9WRE0_9PEZI
MRATPPGTTSAIFEFISPLVRNCPREPVILSVLSLASLIVITSTLLSFTSTILLSDIAVKPIPAGAVNMTVPLDFRWLTDFGQTGVTTSGFHVNYWQSSPPVLLPAFAEYSTAPLVSSGIVDTGSTIRAFLPFTDSKDRTQFQSYKGKALLWDGRVICQKPKISNGIAFVVDKSKYTGLEAIKGTIENTIPFADVVEEPSPPDSQFWCTLLNTVTQLSICELLIPSRYDSPPGAPTLNYFGGLKSEFRTADHKIRPGRAYLLLNFTGGTKPPQKYLEENTEWGEIPFVTSYENTNIQPGQIILGSLCYTAMDAVDREVEIVNSQPMVESQFTTFTNLHLSNPTYNFDTKIISQLIPSNTNPTTMKPPQRGVLTLKKPSSGWAAPELNVDDSDGPWIYNLADVNSFPVNPDSRHSLTQQIELFQNSVVPAGIRGNQSVSFESYLTGFNTIFGFSWILDLYAAVQNDPRGNAALALQAVFTVLLSNVYYDTFSKFDKFANVSLVNFQNVSSPGGPFGQRRGSGDPDSGFDDYPLGYTIVAAALLLHLLLTTIVFALFMRKTAWTRIGDSWQALAQVVSDGGFADVRHIIEHSLLTYSDRETVKQELKDVKKRRVQMGIVGLHDAVKLVRRGGRKPEDYPVL